ncbi:MAG: hypothetical protein KGZ51_06735 [Erysipelothrix sp.]|jgi:hypothetical protein|nr:hypothetical protein [Erysipelothrix sp.]
MYEWVTGNAHALIVRVYPTNITLNASAASFFNDVRYVTIGFNKESNKVAIKPITKREVDLKLVPLEQLHKVSIGKGYGRISNKLVCDEISALIDQPLTGQRFLSQFDAKSHMLVIDLTQVHP